jgi:predicted metal-dependent phosphoesterase TrpH
LGLTDHDTTEGWARAQDAADRLGLEFVPGIEVNTDLPEGLGEAHILGYYLNAESRGLQTKLAQLRVSREARAFQRVSQLQGIGIPITWAQVRALADGPVGTPHIALALVESGVVSSVDEARSTYLNRGKPGYLRRELFTATQAIELIRTASGVAVLAHPADIVNLDNLLTILTTVGLQGIEVYYGQYDEETVQRLERLAEQFHLIPTGGSDFHGAGIRPTPLGGRVVPPEVLGRLKSLKAISN